MTDILLTTANARSSHTAFGLRCLRANMKELYPHCGIREFTIHDKPAWIVESLLAENPKILGLGVYIWNVELLTEVVRILKAVAPEIKVVLGGPEVSFEYEGVTIVEAADVLVTGEGETAFLDVCRRLRQGEEVGRVHDGGMPDLTQLVLPYGEYSTEDLHHRLVYVEASRGCAFRCTFCLSSLDQAVRSFPMDAFLAQMDQLLERGCKCFKFVDRTFNLRLADSLRVLDFFLKRFEDGRCQDVFLHFEMVPDRLPDEIRQRTKLFPKGAIQFEIGIQTFTPAVCAAIDRRMDVKATEANLRFLTQETKVHIHADLIAGLPKETMASFAASFDRLWALAPHDIQLGILKRLKGTKIGTPGMAFSQLPPYDIVKTETMSFIEIQRIKRLARFVDVFVNSGRFQETLAYLLEFAADDSAFGSLMAFTDWVWGRFQVEHGISLRRQFEFLQSYLTEELACSPQEVVGVIRQDFEKLGSRKGMPDFLR